MSTVKVNAIRSTSGTSDAITLNSSSGVTAINGTSLRPQNLIINGAMIVDQRNAGAAYSSGTAYTLDRWKVLTSGTDENPTIIQHALTSAGDGLPWADGLRHSLHITNGNQTGGVDAADRYQIIHHLETGDIRNCGWDYNSTSSYITLSFWIKSSVAQNFYGYVRTPDTTGQSYPFETGSLSADTWTKITKTIPGNANITIDDDDGIGFSLYLNAWLGTDYTGTVTLNQWAAYNSSIRTPDWGSSNDDWFLTNDSTLEITGVQLEVGPTASEYMHETYLETLAKCQRYYFKTFDQGTKPADGLGHDGEIQHLLIATGDPQVNFYFPRPMNHVPDIVLYNPRSGGTSGEWGSNSSDSSNARAFGITKNKTIIDNTDTNLSATYWRIAFTADCEL